MLKGHAYLLSLLVSSLNRHFSIALAQMTLGLVDTPSMSGKNR